jgi:hypothetical protein
MMEAPNGRAQRSLRLGDRPSDHVAGPVTAEDLVESLHNRHPLAIRPGGHVAERQRVEKVRRRSRELRQLGCQPSMTRLDVGAAVVGGEAGQVLVTEASQVASSVERVEAGAVEGRRVADVMQPCSRGQQVSRRGHESRRYTPSLLGDRGGMPPSAALDTEQLAGEVASGGGVEHESSVGTPAPSGD